MIGLGKVKRQALAQCCSGIEDVRARETFATILACEFDER
jgi:hypothetical protein